MTNNHDSWRQFYSFSLEKQNHGLRRSSCLEIRLIKALRNPRAPTVSEGRYLGMVDSASYATCGHRAATQRHRWARANGHVVASKFQGGGATARPQTRELPEDVTSQAVQTPCQIELRKPGLGDGT